ncbi:MAG: 3-hydroxyacyl-CoA dehydrogenase/enoyl-CoA hydratase family protein [Planctomycetes bacterium]|nr:3-hydroxyacyl-CoA dehydrogenase/enoyl-CoA hydratase family protein [Planctomycetota bacterium]
MPYTAFGRTLRKIGVVGSGQIGPDIALYFSKVLHRQGVPVVVVDVAAAALEAGEAKTRKKLDRGVESKAFRAEEADAIFRNITFTGDYAAFAGCDLVIEAATERLPLKQSIFAQLESLCPADAILASNSSHLEPEAIFEKAQHPGRCLCIHYFFPAERNLLVEVIPGARTDAAVADFAMKFYEAIGKAPIRVKSRYGYAVDPIFEGLFQAAALCVEQGLAFPKVVDAIACKALGLGVGPFTAMNLTGGNPITQHGLDEMHGKVNAWFQAPKILHDRIASKQPWEAAGRGEEVSYSPETYEKVSAELEGAFLGLAGEIIDAGLCSTADLEMAVEIGLVMTPPFAVMNRLGVGRVLDRVKGYADRHAGFPVPKCLEAQAASGRPWSVPCVLREDHGDVAVLTIRRPRVLNALNDDVFSQIDAHIAAIQTDPAIRSAVITGFGVKAFVSGADVTMLARIETPSQGESMSRGSQQVLDRIAASAKPVVCAMNGMAFGGGSELALSCAARIARKGLEPLFAQPEVRLGIIPGAGATQRLPRLVGFEKAWPLLRLGTPVSEADALAMGYLDASTDGDLTAEAAALARRVADSGPLRRMPGGPIPVPTALPDLDLGHLSKRIDEILRRAILDGARLPLAEGIAFEARLFGECASTKDMRIGIENFLKNGPRSKAAFVHA